MPPSSLKNNILYKKSCFKVNRLNYSKASTYTIIIRSLVRFRNMRKFVIDKHRSLTVYPTYIISGYSGHVKQGAHLTKPGWSKPYTHSQLIWCYLGIK